MENSISCVIVNYNDSERTLSQVKRIVGYNTITHVIVIDNCSTDSSFKVLNGFRHEKYILLESENNGGYGYGNNIGIRKANEIGDKYVLISNPDVFFDEKCIQDMVQKMSHDLKCAIMNAKETNMGVCAWKYLSTIDDVLSTSIVFNKLLKKRYYSKAKFESTGLTEVDIIQGSFLLVPTSIMIKYGMYDEEFFLFEEEKVMYIKFKQAGFHFLTDLDVSYQHNHIEHGINSIKKYIDGKRILIQSKTKFLEKYRKVTGVSLCLCKLFFRLTILEMALYALFLIARGDKNSR